MNEPTFDKHGYPTGGTCRAIQGWDGMDMPGLREFLIAAWNTTYGKVTNDYDEEGKHVVEFVTGGWSGNEDLIAALAANLVAWSRCWLKSERGGLHVFEFPETRRSADAQSTP